MGVTPIMDWTAKHYDRQYAPNTREAFRRQTLHQFVEAGLAKYNPDQPDRPVISPKAVYQLTDKPIALINKAETTGWKEAVALYLAAKPGLAAHYAAARDMRQAPVKLMNGGKILLSPGIHSILIKDVIETFAGNFTPGATLIYVGDAGAKVAFFDKAFLAGLGVVVDNHGKMPDVKLYDAPRARWS